MSTTDLSDRLLSGERILWSGRPAQGLRLTGNDAMLIPFSLMFAGFAVFWESSVMTAPNVPVFAVFWGAPIVLFGLYLIVGRFLLDAWIRRGMLYAVTNKRILIYRSGPFSKFTALSLERLPDASITERGDGRGTIRFGPAAQFFGGRRGVSSWTPSLDPVPQFIGIENCRNVFDQIQQAGRSGS
jgi:hypothetical protein